MAMPEGGIQVTSHRSLGAPNHLPLIPAFKLQGSGFRVQGSAGQYGAFRHPERSKTSYVKKMAYLKQEN